MIIHYNQQENIELKEGITLNEFLQSKQLSREGVAVAVDEKIVNILCGFVVTRTTIISGE